jgi:hypothetical protein
MSKAINHVKAFIAMNSNAYAAASAVFKQIEAQSDKWAEALAKAGIVGPDIKPFAVAYVAEVMDVQPHPSRNGGELTFIKDSKPYNRVRYLVDVATGAADAKAAKRSSSAKVEVDVVAKLLKEYAALTPAQKKAFKAAL